MLKHFQKTNGPVTICQHNLNTEVIIMQQVFLIYITKCTLKCFYINNLYFMQFLLQSNWLCILQVNNLN